MAKPLPQLTIYRGFVTTGCHVWSPFVNKLETRLRLAGIPYRTDVGSPKQAPRGKIPYIRLQTTDHDEVLADSTLIARQLVDAGVLPDLNSRLTPLERAQDLAIRALLEDKMSFYLARERWVDNYYTMRAGALAALPYFVQVIVGLLAYRNVVRALHGQGVGRFLPDEAREFKREVWEGVDVMLAEGRKTAASAAAREEDPAAPFWVLGGAEPTEADATVYGFVAASLVCPAAPETQKMVREFPVMVDYAKRIHARYFGDYDVWEV